MHAHIGNYARFKRLFDVSVSIVLLIALLPLLLLISLLLFLDDGAPIIFKQMRVGVNGRIFTIWKFRTMPFIPSNKNGHSPDRSVWKNGVPDEFMFKSADPPGVSFLGKWLRKYSLDELPQLINVITGNMSLIGPRPEIPEITRYYNQEQMVRLAVKPGITGYAQVNGRSLLNHGQKMIYDRYYVEHCSFRFDCHIMIRTLIKVIRPKDNY